MSNERASFRARIPFPSRLERQDKHQTILFEAGALFTPFPPFSGKADAFPRGLALKTSSALLPHFGQPFRPIIGALVFSLPKKMKGAALYWTNVFPSIWDLVSGLRGSRLRPYVIAITPPRLGRAPRLVENWGRCISGGDFLRKRCAIARSGQWVKSSLSGRCETIGAEERKKKLDIYRRIRAMFPERKSFSRARFAGSKTRLGNIKRDARGVRYRFLMTFYIAGLSVTRARVGVDRLRFPRV